MLDVNRFQPRQAGERGDVHDPVVGQVQRNVAVADRGVDCDEWTTERRDVLDAVVVKVYVREPGCELEPGQVLDASRSAVEDPQPGNLGRVETAPRPFAERRRHDGVEGRVGNVDRERHPAIGQLRHHDPDGTVAEGVAVHVDDVAGAYPRVVHKRRKVFDGVVGDFELGQGTQTGQQGDVLDSSVPDVERREVRHA